MEKALIREVFTTMLVFCAVFRFDYRRIIVNVTKPNLVKILKEELTEINKKEYVVLDILLDVEGIQIKVSDFKPVEEWKKIKEKGYFLYGRRKYQFKYPVTLRFDGATDY